MNIYIPSINDIIHETSVDFILRPCAKEIHIVQYDKSLPIIKVELFRNGERYQLPQEAIVNVRFGKIDHTFVYKHILGTNPERNAVYFEIDEQMTLLPSRVGPVIEVIYNNRISNSSPVQVIIDKNPIQNNEVESEDYFPIIYELQATALDHENRISALEQGGSPMYVLRLNENPNSVYAHNLSDQYDIRYSIEELANSLVQRDGNNKIYASNIVTLDTEQSIEASKLFESTVTFEDTVTILYTPENSSDAIPKSYADEIDERKLELHSFNGFVGGTQVHDQISNGKIMYCQSGTQTNIDPTQSPIINIELTQEHITAVSNRKAMYIKSIEIWYTSDDDPTTSKKWYYSFEERIFGSGSNQDDINPKVVTLTDPNTGQELEWTLIYRPAAGKQYYGSYNSTKGQQFGSNTNPADYISLYTTSLQNVTVTRVEIEISGNSGTNAHGKITLVQDNWKYITADDYTVLEYATATATNDNYMFLYPSYVDQSGTHLGTGGGTVIQYEHVFLKKENNEVTTVQANSDYLYIEENGTSDSYRLYKFVDNQMQEVSKTRLGTTSDTAYRGDYGQDNYNKLNQVREQTFTFTGVKTFNDEVWFNSYIYVDHIKSKNEDGGYKTLARYDDNGYYWILENISIIGQDNVLFMQAEDSDNPGFVVSPLAADSYRLMNIASPINDTDGANKKYVDSNFVSKTLLNNQSQISGGTYPRLLKYNDKKLYLFLDNRYRVSEDGGKTWSEPVTLFTTSTETQESGRTITDAGNAYAFLSRNNDGRIVVIYRSLNRNTPFFSICAKVSDTNGENFGARQELFNSTSGYWEPFYYKGWIYYSSEHNGSGSDKAQSIYRRTLRVDFNGVIDIGSSTRFLDGRTKVDTDGNVNDKSRLGMISATPVYEGHIFVFESSVNINASIPRPMVVQYCYSKHPEDGVASPTSVVNLFLGSSGKKCGAPFVTTLDDGRIVISFQTNEKYTGYNRTDFRDNQFVAFVSKRKVNYGDELTADDFVKITTYEYGENEYGVWGSVSNIDGILYKTFSIGVNKSTTTNTEYGNLVQKCLLEIDNTYDILNNIISEQDALDILNGSN